MSLTLATVMALAQQCAPGIALEAIVPQVHVESHFDALAIGVNNGPQVRARSKSEAVALARRLIDAGYSIDLGLAQINSANLVRLGLSVEDAFDPCRSLEAAETVLDVSYRQAAQSRSGRDAIEAAWSLYNTGSSTRGIRNGYVGRIWREADRLMPRMRAILTTGDGAPPETADGSEPPRIAQAAPRAQPGPARTETAGRPDWFYGTPNAAALVFKND
ncbi:MAG: lytic transglycosylase domain-containing protein [Sphingomonadales bacterium]|nr:lytic transglycosylase domain-containing protein [Sphingomonadales bacterium]